MRMRIGAGWVANRSSSAAPMSFAGTQSSPTSAALRAGLVRRVGAVALGDRHGARGAGVARQRPQEARGVLGRQHAEDRGRAAAAPAPWPIQRPARQRDAAILVVPAVEPQLAAGRHRLDQRPARQLLQPRRPVDRGEPLARSPHRRCGTAPRAAARCRRPRSRHCRSGARRPAPAPAGRGPAGRFRSGSRPAVGVTCHSRPMRNSGAASLAASAAITSGAHLALAADHRRHGALQDAGLLGGDALELVAEEAGVVVADRRDGREHRIDHVGGVAAGRPCRPRARRGRPGRARRRGRPRPW